MPEYRLGRLVLSLSGQDPLLDYLRDEFLPIRTEEAGEAHLSFEFGAELPSRSGHVRLAPLWVGPDGYAASHGGMEYYVDGVPPRVRVRIRALKSFTSERIAPGWMLRSGNSNYLLPSEKVARTFMYNVFDYLTQIVNLGLGQSYMHASSFAKDDRAVAVIAWGGVGKTTSMLKLVGQEGWRFLSDDLGLIDEDGILYRTPKRLQVYAYNVQGEPWLYRTLMGGRSPLDRAAWHLRVRTLGVKRVRRRVSAEELMGEDRVADHAKLTDALFMERADIPAIEIRDMSTRQLAERAAATLIRETQPLQDLTAAMYSCEWHPVLPAPGVLYERTLATLERCFDAIPVSLVRIPLAATPDELATFLSETLAT